MKNANPTRFGLTALQDVLHASWSLKEKEAISYGAIVPFQPQSDVKAYEAEPSLKPDVEPSTPRGHAPFGKHPAPVPWP